MSEATVRVDGEVVGSIGQGLLVLVGVHRTDEPEAATWVADRVAKLRIFNDAGHKMNLALSEVGGSVLAISNFTVYGETSKNRRPSFTESAGFEDGQRLFDAFVESLRGLDVPTETGIFGADMKVSLINDGPVTVMIDSN